MRHTPHYILDDEVELRRLVRENPWCTIVSATREHGLVASHYPFLLDEEAEELTLLSHVGRPDETLHELGDHEVLVIVQGPHGYVSPSWYEPGDIIPTWNHVTAHLYGTPQILSDDENLRVLAHLTEHFEQARRRAARPAPRRGVFSSRGTGHGRPAPEGRPRRCAGEAEPEQARSSRAPHRRRARGSGTVRPAGAGPRDEEGA